MIPFFLLLFSVPPEKPKIFDEREQEMRLKLGPYKILGKLHEALSPNKTWEGAVGAIFGACASAYLLPKICMGLGWDSIFQIPPS